MWRLISFIDDHFGPPWRLLEAKHNTPTAHFGTLTQCSVHPSVVEVKTKYAYVFTKDICNKFIEAIFLCNVWFLGQIVYFKIEHPSIINKVKSWYVSFAFHALALIETLLVSREQKQNMIGDFWNFCDHLRIFGLFLHK